jgi:tetratricopeptide (TPR) repeat protein
MVPFTVELTIEPGPVEPGGARDGFGESSVILSPTDKMSMSRAADLRWGSERLATGTTVATFLDTFWNGRSVSHPDALDFGRALSRRLLGHPALRERWREIRAWRGERPLRLELVLPPARTSAIGAVPFELLADEDGFWFYGGQSSLVRCIADLEPRPARIPTNARLQVAWANPLDIASRVDDSVFEDHGALLTRAGKAAGLDVQTTLPRVGLEELQDSLAARRPVAIVSIVAHGSQSGGSLALEAPGRGSCMVPASTVAAALRAAEVQVALLWTCHAARHHEDLGSLAERLLHPEGGDLSAVLAAHGAVRASWTPRAAKLIFDALTGVAANDLERAVTCARQAVREEDPAWATLSYYARPRDGGSVSIEGTIAALTESAVAGDRIIGVPARPYYWVDRPREVAELLAQLRAHRLVTVRGMPGIGKTEVARAAAERAIGEPAVGVDQVLWVALDDVRSVEHLRARAADWVGLADPDAPDWRIARAIGERRALWILDNAEDLLLGEGATLRGFLTALIEQCPGLRLLVTSQRPVGDLRSLREETVVVRRIGDPATCERLFAAASGSPLDERASSDEARDLVGLLDGHPRSLVLVASQVRDGGANLGDLARALRQRGSDVIMAPALLESGTDWTDEDHRRAEHLVASLHLAYLPLLERAPAAAELFTWLGLLPAGLPLALTRAVFGDDARAYVATLDRYSLVEVRGADERLDLPAPVRWYAAQRLATDVPVARQAELLARTFDALASLLTSAYTRLGKPGASVVIELSRRESLNLEALLDHATRLPSTAGVANLAAKALSRWSQVRVHGGRLGEPLALLERGHAFVVSHGGDGKHEANTRKALGDLYVRTARLTEAASAYEAALTAYRALDDRLGEANTQQALGDLYLRTDRLPEAEAAYEAALMAYRGSDDRLGEANSRRALGDLYLRTARLRAAEVAYEAALTAYRAIDDRLGEANTLQALGVLYVRTARLTEAEAAYEAALTAYRAIDARLGEANTQKALGDLYVRTARLTEAEAAYEAALTAHQAIDDRLGEATTRLALGALYLRRARLTEAEAAYEAALTAYQAIDSRLGEANTRQALGDLYVRTNRLTEAEAAYDAALPAYRAIDDRLGEANTRKALGGLYVRTARLPEAEAAHAAALTAYRAIDDRLGEANTRKALGDLYVRTARLPEAEDAYAAALTAYGAIDDRLGEANTRKALGDLYVRTDRLTAAAAAYEAALTAYRAIDARLGEANTQKALGDLYVRTARLTEAETAYEAALTAYQAIDDRLGEANTRKALGDLYVRTDRLTEAEAAYDAALTAYREIDDRLGEANTRRALGGLYVRTDRLTEAEAAYDAALTAYRQIDDQLGEANTRSALGVVALTRGHALDAFEAFRQTRVALLRLEERLGAAGQLGYMARAAAALGDHDRALVLGGTAWSELHALADRYGEMLAATDLVRPALASGDESLVVLAVVIAFHHAREIDPPLAAQLEPLAAAFLGPEKAAAGLSPPELEELREAFVASLAAVKQRLTDRGEDPMSAPRPAPPSLPPEDP